MRSRTSRSFSILLALLAALALVAGACSSDSEDTSEKDSGSETTKGEEDSGNENSEEDPEADPAEPEVSTEEFSAAVADATKAVEEASDACDLYSASAALQLDRAPQTSEEAREYVDFNVVLFNKMAETAPDEATAEILRTGAQNFKDYAEGVDYDLEKLNNDSAEEPFEGATELSEVLNTYGEEVFKECAPSEGAPTPEGDTNG